MNETDKPEQAERHLLQRLRDAYQQVHAADTQDFGKEMPRGRYVYLLSCDGELVVAGQGEKARAVVVLDAPGGRVTIGHVKSLFVRLVRKYRPRSRFLGLWIGPLPSDEAKRIEADIHKRFGGNALALPSDVHHLLERDLAQLTDSAALIVRLAILSYYSGLSDLRRWAQAGLIQHGDAIAIDTLLAGAICTPGFTRRDSLNRR
jgi:hypothetical protein